MPLGTSCRAKDSPLDDDGVAGVVAPLVADHDLHLLGEQIGQLALALVAPLGADDYGTGHARLLRKFLRRSEQCTAPRGIAEVRLKLSGVLPTHVRAAPRQAAQGDGGAGTHWAPPRQGVQSAPPSPTFSGVTVPLAASCSSATASPPGTPTAAGRARPTSPLSALGEEQARDAAPPPGRRRLRPGRLLGPPAGPPDRGDPGRAPSACRSRLDPTPARDRRRRLAGSDPGRDQRARGPGALADWSEGRSESTPGGETRGHLTERARAALLRVAAEAARRATGSCSSATAP